MEKVTAEKALETIEVHAYCKAPDRITMWDFRPFRSLVGERTSLIVMSSETIAYTICDFADRQQATDI